MHIGHEGLSAKRVILGVQGDGASVDRGIGLKQLPAQVIKFLRFVQIVGNVCQKHGGGLFHTEKRVVNPVCNAIQSLISLPLDLFPGYDPRPYDYRKDCRDQKQGYSEDRLQNDAVR